MSRATLPYLGPYRLLNVVHSGHAAQIWQAYDDANQRMVGIKALSERCRSDKVQIGYLRWEYAVGSKLDHPRLLKLLSYAVDRGRPYIAMEWFSAPNMKQRIQQGMDKIAGALPKVVEQSCEALSAFAEEGWVHRDIKPDNFLVADSGDVKLIDFTLAQKPAGAVGRLLGKLIPGKAKVQGTRSYMSPEQIRGEPLGQTTDVYSMGCTLHELICGKAPFTGANAQELLNKHLKATPPLLDCLQWNITPEFAQLVRRCLSKDPKARPASPVDLYQELRQTKVFRVAPRTPGKDKE